MNFNPPFPAPQHRAIIFSLNLVLLLISVTSAAQKEIEITSFYAKVYVAPSTNANFIGLTQKGERYSILGIRGTWYYIRFKNANGWVEASQLRVIDPYAEATRETEIEGTDETKPGTSVVAAESPSPREPVDEERRATQPTDQIPSPETRPAYPYSATTPSPPDYRTPVQSRSTQTRRTTTREQKSPEKKESRLRSWFTQQNLPQLPPTLMPADSQTTTAIRYFQVRYPSRVLEFLSPEAPILGMAKRGELLPLVSEGESWCRVAFNDTIGWVESKNGRIIDPDMTVAIDYVKIGLIAGGVVVVAAALALLLFVLLRSRKKAEAFADNVVTRHVLIVAESTKIIQYTLTNGTTTLERCFVEVGFSTTFARDLSSVKNYLQQQVAPDVILVDYHLDKNIITSLERICAPLGFAESILFIVYNVPDPAVMQAGKVLPKMAFLGLTFSDRDVFKLVTPMLRSADGDAIQKSVQSSALAGDIAAGNLLEVLQFIEIGSKTGCLLIEMGHPFAIICFKNGRIIFAATADKITGRDAIFKVLDLKIGKFRFVLDKKPKESNVNLSTLEVLMEWAKAVDEAHGH